MCASPDGLVPLNNFPVEVDIHTDTRQGDTRIRIQAIITKVVRNPTSGMKHLVHDKIRYVLPKSLPGLCVNRGRDWFDRTCTKTI